MPPDVQLLKGPDGRPAGEAYITFGSRVEAERAVTGAQPQDDRQQVRRDAYGVVIRHSAGQLRGKHLSLFVAMREDVIGIVQTKLVL